MVKKSRSTIVSSDFVLKQRTELHPISGLCLLQSSVLIVILLFLQALDLLCKDSLLLLHR